MIISELGKKRLLETLQWRESDEYSQICAKHKVQCDRLVRIGEEFLKEFHAVDQKINGTVVKLEYASGSDLHRGVYCPSPILDIVVGKVHRGRILKRVTAASKISHCYGYDSEHNLLYCKSMYDGEMSSTEYLYTTGSVRYGISVSSNWQLVSISEEVFVGKQVQKYSYIEVYPEGDGYFCANLHIERYFYDEIGLKSCEKEDFQPYVNTLSAYRYDFERENGYLSSYSSVEVPHKVESYGTIEFPRYVVGVKRKA